MHYLRIGIEILLFAWIVGALCAASAIYFTSPRRKR